MGKATGFLEYERKNAAVEEPLKRIRHFNEFRTPLPLEEQQKQGARCMECGVPFCQNGAMLAGMASGCPLHNLVPVPGVYQPCLPCTLRGGMYL